VAWREELAGLDPACLIFIDASGIDTRLTRAYGRAARGQRAVGKVPHGNWERLTVIGALALDGVVAAMSIAAATSTAVFLAFAEQVPALKDRPDAVVVMDNLPAHKAAAVREALDRAGLAHRGPWPRAGAAGPGAPTLLAGSEPDRASVVQAQDPPARDRRPLA
jgi:DDE superfamily endonuclease